VPPKSEILGLKKANTLIALHVNHSLTSARQERSKNVRQAMVAPGGVHCKEKYVAFLLIFSASSTVKLCNFNSSRCDVGLEETVSVLQYCVLL